MGPVEEFLDRAVLTDIGGTRVPVIERSDIGVDLKPLIAGL